MRRDERRQRRPGRLVATRLDPPADVWTAPIETVSNSEAASSSSTRAARRCSARVVTLGPGRDDDDRRRAHCHRDTGTGLRGDDRRVTRGRLAVHAHFYQPSRARPVDRGGARRAVGRAVPRLEPAVDAECYRPNAERGNLAAHLVEPRPDARPHGWRSRPRDLRPVCRSRRRTRSPSPSTTRSCRSRRRPIGGPRSPGASATSSCGSAGGRPGSGCRSRRSTSRRSGGRRQGITLTILAPWQAATRRSTPAGRIGSSSATAGGSSSSSTTAGLSAAVSFEPEATADADRFARERVASAARRRAGAARRAACA